MQGQAVKNIRDKGQNMQRKFLTAAAMVVATIGLATPAQAVELVTNGGFETGNFSGWTLGGNTGFTSVTSNPTYVHSGTYGAALGPVNSNGEISQLLSTITGQTYTISFWLRNDGGTPNDFYAYFGSQQLLATVNQGASAFFNYTYQATETAPTLLRFSFQQDPAYWGLDDISVDGPRGNTVPEPATWAMMLLGFGGIGMAMRRRRQPALAQIA
jgi:hypothetical protein